MQPPFETIARWWRDWTARRAAVEDLDCCGAEQTELIARDVGISVPELRALAGRWPESTNLLSRRLAALGLDENAIRSRQPAVLQDLQRVCTLCSNSEDCKYDLARNPNDPVWHVYCPNVMTLEALAAERANARKSN